MNDPESGVQCVFSIAEELPSQMPVHGRQPDLPLPQHSATHFDDPVQPSPTTQRIGSVPHLEPPIISLHPHVEQVRLFSSSYVLSKIHTLCIFFAAIGFVLAIAGIVLYA